MNEMNEINDFTHMGLLAFTVSQQAVLYAVNEMNENNDFLYTIETAVASVHACNAG